MSPRVTCLVDLGVLRELSAADPDPGVTAWSNGVSRVALSAVTLEEMEYWLASRPNARVREWADRFFVQHAEVLPVSAEIARRAGALRGSLEASGRGRTRATMLIAATAAHHGLTLVTRHPRAFDGCGVAVLDPSQ